MSTIGIAENTNMNTVLRCYNKRKKKYGEKMHKVLFDSAEQSFYDVHVETNKPMGLKTALMPALTFQKAEG